MGYRILYLGNDWYGSCARACGYALRRLGHEVIDVSADNYAPTGKRFLTKVLLQGARKLLEREFNAQVLDTAKRLQPDFLLTFKGCMVFPSTLQSLRAQGLPLYQYFPDNSVFAHKNVYPETMTEYDCCFFTKKFLISDTRKHLPLRDAVYIPHGYDSEIHHVPELTDRDRELYASEVIAIMSHTPGKEQFFDQLLSLRPDLPLKIWGGGWHQRCASARVKAKTTGVPLYGQAYVRAIRASKINLALLIEETKGSSQGDQTTTRSFEIPACGGFMLHQRTEDILELYREGSEIECFSSPSEALSEIEHYLKHPSEREQVARRGYERAVPAYSYDARMTEILQYHAARCAARAAIA